MQHQETLRGQTNLIDREKQNRIRCVTEIPKGGEEDDMVIHLIQKVVDGETRTERDLLVREKGQWQSLLQPLRDAIEALKGDS